MATDKRITRAKKILKEGVERGARDELASPNRATGTRKRYKAGYEAAREALEVLNAKA
jgi:hypothetical protein